MTDKKSGGAKGKKKPVLMYALAKGWTVIKDGKILTGSMPWGILPIYGKRPKLYQGMAKVLVCIVLEGGHEKNS